MPEGPSKNEHARRAPVVIENSYLEKDIFGYNVLQLARGRQIPQYGDLFRFSVQNGKPEADEYFGRFTYDIQSRIVNGVEFLDEGEFKQALNSLSNPEKLLCLPPKLPE